MTAPTGRPQDPGQRAVTAIPTILFVCIRNSGKSQMAAALMRKHAGDTITVQSAGTQPGTSLNQESVASLDEVGATIDDEHPKLATPELLANADLIVLVGDEVQLDDAANLPIERWITDEPSQCGINGAERMRIIRDDIDRRTSNLAQQLRTNGTEQTNTR